MFEVATIGLVVTMVLALIRAAKGPTVFDRILAVNMFGTMTVLLIAVSGFYYARPDWDVALTIDIALVYALVNFSGTVAVCKYARFKNLANCDRRPT